MWMFKRKKNSIDVTVYEDRDTWYTFLLLNDGTCDSVMHIYNITYVVMYLQNHSLCDTIFPRLCTFVLFNVSRTQRKLNDTSRNREINVNIIEAIFHSINSKADWLKRMFAKSRKLISEMCHFMWGAVTTLRLLLLPGWSAEHTHSFSCSFQENARRQQCITRRKRSSTKYYPKKFLDPL